MKKRKLHIQEILVRSIALTLFAVLVAMLAISGALMQQTRAQVGERLGTSLDDAMAQAVETAQINEIIVLSTVGTMFDEEVAGGSLSMTGEALRRIADTAGMDIIEILDQNGLIVASTNDAHTGINYNEESQTKALFEVMQDELFGAQDVDSCPLYDNQPMHFAYLSWPGADGSRLFAVGGESETSFSQLVAVSLMQSSSFRRVGEHGYMLYCDDVLMVLSTINSDLTYTTLTLKNDLGEVCDQNLVVDETIAGEPAYVSARRVPVALEKGEDSFFLLAVYPQKEAMQSLVRARISLILFGVLLYVALLLLLSRQMREHVVKRVIAVNQSLSRITAGDLSMRVDVMDSVEFEQLSQGINATVDKLEDLIQQEARRLDEELALARTIQRTALPNVFPPFPEREDFGLFASMYPAREVGGDFYDFFMVSDDELAVLVADVSDKGVPAALFMMRAKAAIKALAVSGLPVDEVVARVNDDLCEDNEAGMFVTAWIGILDLRTGLMEYVHAGHTCPIFVSGDATSLVKKRRNFIMGGQPHMPYARQEIQFKPGDALYLYSDGVTESFSAQEELYGHGRLEDVLGRASAEADKANPNQYCEEVCAAVKWDMDVFTAGAQQSDDITMLCVRYDGPRQTMTR